MVTIKYNTENIKKEIEESIKESQIEVILEPNIKIENLPETSAPEVMTYPFSPLGIIETSKYLISTVLPSIVGSVAYDSIKKFFSLVYKKIQHKVRENDKFLIITRAGDLQNNISAIAFEIPFKDLSYDKLQQILDSIPFIQNCYIELEKYLITSINVVIFAYNLQNDGWQIGYQNPESYGYTWVPIRPIREYKERTKTDGYIMTKLNSQEILAKYDSLYHKLKKGKGVTINQLRGEIIELCKQIIGLLIETSNDEEKEDLKTQLEKLWNIKN